MERDMSSVLLKRIDDGVGTLAFCSNRALGWI